MSQSDESHYVAAYNASRQSSKPVCTHSGKVCHTVQKCFKLHGYPPHYKTTGYRNQSQSQPKTTSTVPNPAQSQSSQTQLQINPAHTANAISNAYSTAGQSYYSVPNPHLTMGGNNVMLQNFTPQQIQSLIAQFNSHVRV